MKRWLLLLFNLALQSLAHASSDSSLSKQLDFQEQLEKRLTSRVRLYDPIGSALVKITFKEISAPLPGTKLHVEKFLVANQGSITTDSIKQIDVTVMTAKDDLVQWMRDDIASGLALSGVKIKFDYKIYSDAQRAQFDKVVARDAVGEELVKRSDVIASAIMQISNKLNQDLLQKLLGGLLGLCALAVVLGLYLSNRHSTFLRQMIRDEVLPFLKTMQANAALKAPERRIPVETQTRRAERATVQESPREAAAIERLDIGSLEALLGDCYWCEQDGYASFLWSAMTREQQQQVIERKVVDPAYLRYLRGRPAENLGLHNDPNYVSPLPVGYLSQSDLAEWVKRNPSAWHELSYLRQSSLPMRLQERLKCLSSPQGGVKAESLRAIPGSARRALPVLELQGEITLEDEQFILENPESVPAGLRASIPSLIWLMQTPENVQARILSSVDAAQLSEAWIGPAVVLERLAQSLPDQKRTIVESNVQRRVPNRAGSVMRYLVTESLKYLEQAEAKANQRKAA